MVTHQQIQGYAKKLYQQNQLKECVVVGITLLALEYLNKVKPERKQFRISNLVSHVDRQLFFLSPDFFTEEELWLDASNFILSYLEYWHTNSRFAKAVFKDFEPILFSPSGYIKADQIETLQQAENFLIGTAAYRIIYKISTKSNLPNFSSEALEFFLGITKLEKISKTIGRNYNSSMFFSHPLLVNEDIEALSAKSILSSISVKMGKNKKNKQVKILLKHLPKEIAEFRLKCPKCSQKFRPNWFRLSNEPHIPIKPNDHDGPGRWIPTKTYEECPFCKEIVPLELPVVKMQSKVRLFGDEAYREAKGKLVFTYSLVGADVKIVQQIEDSLRDLKSKLVPSEDPDSWGFHMKEIWSGHNRRKNKIFCNWDQHKVSEAIQGVFQLIQNHAEYLFIYNIALTTKGSMRGFKSKPSLEHPRDNAYILLIAYVINELTAKGAQPILQFDAEKKVKANQVIQSWASNAFSSSQYCLLYPFLARGVEIPEPIFVKPGSHPCLEIADFVSYLIARFHFNKWQGKQVELNLDPQNLGKATYLGFDDTGDLVFHRTNSYPWELFYGN